MPASITVRPSAPTVVQDYVQLAPKVPDLPEDVLQRFPRLREWQDDVEKWWNRNYVAIQSFAGSVGGEVDLPGGGDSGDLQAQFDAFTAAIVIEVGVIANEQEAQAKQIVTVSAMAGVSTGIKVQTTAPVSPSVNDYWIDNSDITAPITYQWDGLAWVEVTEVITAAAVAEERTARVTADGFLEGKYTLTVVAGDVITGFNITSASGSGTNVSNVAWTADQFQIYSGTSKKTMFVADGVQDKVRVANTLTVDGANTAVYVRTAAGAGAYNDASTFWYVDATGKMSLKTKFLWDGSSLFIDGSGTFTGSITATVGAIGGWFIGPTTLSNNNAILDSAGQLILGTSNDVVIVSANDATYRIWIGNATSGSAAFRVTKAGLMTATGATISGAITATSGTIGGFTINSTDLTGGSGATTVQLNSGAASGILVGDATGLHAILSRVSNVAGVRIYNSSNVLVGLLSCASGGSNAGQLDLYDSSGAGSVIITGSDQKITFSNDTNIYRSAANTLKTDDSFVVGGGTITLETDVSIYRASADVLRTDDSFKVGGNFTITPNATGTTLSSSGTGADAGTSVQFTNKVLTVLTDTGSGVIFFMLSSSRSFVFTDQAYCVQLTNGGISSPTGKFTTNMLMDASAKLEFWAIGNGTYIDESNGLQLHGDSSHPIKLIGTGTQLQLLDGSQSAPSLSFQSDPDTGWFWNSSGDMRATTNATSRLVIRDGAIVCLVDLKLATTRSAGSPTPGGTITILDASGATVSLITT